MVSASATVDGSAFGGVRTPSTARLARRGAAGRGAGGARDGGRGSHANGDRVHFRPSSTGVSMVGLLPDRPQRGKSGIHDLGKVARDFKAMFAAHCRDIDHGRVTGEKALRSFLIREAYQNERRMVSLDAASRATSEVARSVREYGLLPRRRGACRAASPRLDDESTKGSHGILRQANALIRRARSVRQSAR